MGGSGGGVGKVGEGVADGSHCGFISGWRELAMELPVELVGG